MSIGTPPDDSGLPQLPVPTKIPKTFRQRFPFVVVLYLISQRDDGHLSHRELTEFLGRASRTSIKKLLDGFQHQKFLKNPYKGGRRGRPLTHAHRYEPGPKLAGGVGEDWRVLAETLCGEEGICRGILARWAFGAGFLELNGMLILGSLANSERPLKTAELHAYLGMFVSSEQTVQNRLEVARKHRLVSKRGAFWQISSDFWERLAEFETQKGPLGRRHRVRTQHAVERRAFGIKLRGGSITPKDEALLRQQGCIRCGKTNQQHRRETGRDLSMEHFPPRAWLRHWGINDHVDLNWAICEKENVRYGQIAKRHKPPALPRIARVELRAPNDADRIALAKLETAIQKFYKAIDDGNDDLAANIAARAFVLWHALVLGPSAVEIRYFDKRNSSDDGVKRLGHKRKIRGRRRPET